jgi:hypothetical protein
MKENLIFDQSIGHNQPSLVATWQNIRDIRRASVTAEIE